MSTLSFARCAEILEAQKKRGYDSKKLANNTYLHAGDDVFVIKLHNTEIIKIHDGGVYELFAGSWQTSTTKERLNEFSPARIYQRKGVWYLQDFSRGDTIFFDGVKLNQSGEVLNAQFVPTYQLDKSKKLDSMINAYIRGFEKKILADGLMLPEGGDCWLCKMYADNHQTDSCDHLFSHLQEHYYHGSIFAYALKVKGYRNPGFIYQLTRQEVERGDASNFKRCLRYLFAKKRDALMKFVGVDEVDKEDRLVAAV